MLLLVPLALAAVVARCAPQIGPLTMSAIVTYESGAHPYAIGDNSRHRAYFPTNRGAAETLATRLLREGHDIDVGYAQINVSNLRRLGLTPQAAFEPCTNVAVGAGILRSAYAGAVRAYGPGQIALVHALSAYNTGGYFAGLAYARGVYAAAAVLRFGRAVPLSSRFRVARGIRAVTWTPARPSAGGR